MASTFSYRTFLMVNFDKNDPMCSALDSYKIDCVFVDASTKLDLQLIKGYSVCLFNLTKTDYLAIRDLLSPLHQDECASNILLYCDIEEVELYSNDFPNFDFIFSNEKFAKFNQNVIQKKLNSVINKSYDRLSDEYIDKLNIYRTVLNASPEAIILLDEDGTILGSNDYIYESLIKYRQDYTGQNIFDLLSIGLSSLLSVNLKNAISSHQPTNFTFKHFEYVNEYRIIPVDEKRNDKQLAVVFAQNITEKVYAEKALRFNSEIVSSVINNLPVVIWNIGADGVLKFAAGSFKNIKEISSDISVGTNINDLIISYPEFYRNIVNAQEGKISYSIDKLGDVFLESYYSRVFDDDGSFKSLIGITNDISEKISAEIDLELEKNKLRFAFDISNDSFWEYDIPSRQFSIYSFTVRSGTIALGSKATRDEFIKVIHNDDKDYFLNQLLSLEQGVIKSTEVQYRIISNEGRWIWLESKAGIFEFDQFNKPQKIIGVSQDITDKVAMDREMQESRNTLETIINSGDHYFALFDKQMRVVAFNKLTFEHLLTFVGSYIRKGMSLSELIYLEPGDESFSAYFKLACEGVSSKYEYNYSRYIGTDYWVEHFIDPVRSIDGSVVAVNLLAKPINDRKLYEVALSESKMMMEAILGTAPVAICLTASDKIVWSNTFWNKLFLRSDQLDNFYSFSEFTFDKINPETILDRIDEAQDKGLELQMRDTLGNILDCLVFPRMINKDKSEKNILLSVVDITEQKSQQQLKEELLQEIIRVERRNNEALQLVENSARIASIGVIAGGITHEINQPLNAIRVASEGILFWNKNHNMALPEQITRLINKISNATLKVDDIIQHMRAYWVESSKNTLAKVNLSEAIQKALSLTLQRVQSHEIYLKIEHRQGDLIVSANPLHLEIIINNLVINAMQALDHTTIKEKTITISTGITDERIYLRVEDNGIGLPDVPSESLFDPFFSTKQEESGTGLGLAIVKLFATRFAAEVVAENNSTGGASFSIYFSN